MTAFKPAAELVCNDINRKSPRAFEGALPDPRRAPPELIQIAQCALVSGPVALDLFPPEFLPRGRPLEQVAIMPVPETPVYENRCCVL